MTTSSDIASVETKLHLTRRYKPISFYDFMKLKGYDKKGKKNE